MENPPGKKPQANATIQIDRVDLDEILLLNPGEEDLPPAASVPPPLPPEELARAASLAPVGSLPPPESKPNRAVLIGIGFVAVLAVAITAGVLVGNAVRRTPAPTSAASATPPTNNAAAAQPAASIEPPTQTITIHTMELGGKETTDQ